MPRALARSVVRLALLRGADGRPVGLEHAERLLDLVMGARRGTLMLPRLQAELVGSEVRLRRRRGRSAAVSTIPSAGPPGTSSLVALSIPGEAVLGDGRIVSSAVRQSPVAADELIRLSGPLTALVDGGRFSRLAVRFRQPGDRFRPLGMAGRRKLQDYFVDRKVPRVERDRTPLVVDEDDQIVWVAGHGISGDFRVSEATRAVVILKLRGERV
jgi:tRNA(Ile)-lysidine synthase